MGSLFNTAPVLPVMDPRFGSWQFHKSSTKQNTYIKDIISNGVQNKYARLTYHITDILLINQRIYIYIYTRKIETKGRKQNQNKLIHRGSTGAVPAKPI
jgi:hypothetical protein